MMRFVIVPDDWSWKRDAAEFYSTHHTFFCAAAAAYYPLVFGLKAYFKDRKAIDLGGGGSKASINYIFWWEVGLALFSIVGAYHVVPLMLEPMMVGGQSFTETVCGPGVHDDPRSFWSFLFMLSKVAEFGDTIFVVLRKKPLILLQHYHHLATMLYCWYGTRFVYAFNNTNVFFAGMNLLVHSMMYSWYAATRTGWKSPKPLMMAVTLLQLVQMVGGCLIVYTSIRGASASCGTWLKEDPISLYGCGFMYFSYLVLFAKLFFENYVAPKKPSKKRA
jgi:elongation of very long chain fatty acids protein 6